jgi:signal peptidase II
MGHEPTSARLAGRSPRAIARFLFAAILLIAADLASKAIAFERVAGAPVTVHRDSDPCAIPRHDMIVVVPKVLALRLTVNEGAVFGLGQGGRWIFIAFSVVAVGVIATVFARSASAHAVLHLSLASVLAGAIGNLHDRLRFGVVRDFLRLFPDVNLPFGWHWPGGDRALYPWIFNVADACLVVGLVVLMVLLHRHDRRTAAKGEAAPA